MKKDATPNTHEYLCSDLFDSVKISKAIKNETLQGENKPVEYVYFIIEGIAREHHNFDDGRDINISFWTSPALIGSLFNSGEGTKAHTSLSMVTCGKYKKIPIRTFINKISLDSNGNHWMNCILETQYHWLRKRSLLLSHKNAEDRVREFIRAFPTFYKMIPDYHIASYLGITPVTMHRAKTKLLKQKTFA